jgi:hypothetical protein
MEVRYSPFSSSRFLILLTLLIDDLRAIADHVEQHLAELTVAAHQDPASLLRLLTMLRNRLNTQSNDEHKAADDLICKLLKSLCHITGEKDWVKDGGDTRWLA